MAALWSLPVVFVCQNNRYGEKRRYELATRSRHDRRSAASSYEMPGVTVDGNDPRGDVARPRARRSSGRGGGADRR